LEKYRLCSNENKEVFFKDVQPIKQTLHGYFEKQQIQQRHLINAPIIDVIIGEMFWNIEDVEG